MRAFLIATMLVSTAFADTAPPPKRADGRDDGLIRALASQGRKPPAMTCGNREPLAAGAVKDGTYVGREPITFLPGRDPGPAGSKWFHEVVITIADGSVTSSERPVVYIRGERHESVSEGGFYEFEGCLAVEGDHYTTNVRVTSQEYGGQSKVESTKTLSIKPLDADIAVNGKRYRRRAVGSAAVADQAASAIGPRARCPTSVLDAKTSIVDTKSGVDVTITSVDAKRVEEIRRRAGLLVEAMQIYGALLSDVGPCELSVRQGTATAQDVDGGVKVSLRAQTPAAVEALQSETHQRHQRVLDELAQRHAILLVDTRSPSEVWIDGVASGYWTPTDGIILPPGLHEVAVQDGAGRRSAAMGVLLRAGDTRRLYVAPAK